MHYQRIKLRLKQSLPVQGQSIDERSLLRLFKDGRSVDCAPLPGLHSESLDDCERWLASGTGSLKNLPSLRSALELLDCRLPQTRIPSSLFRGSCLLALPPPKEAQSFLDAWKSPFSVFKIKIGRQDSAYEKDILKEICQRTPDIELRLDANRSLSPAAFCALADSLSGLSIRYFEEPCGDSEELLRLCADYPIALDESLREKPSEDLLSAAAAWVIKPNCLGWAETLRFFQMGNERKKAIVLSNAFESAPMLQAYAWFYGQLVHRPEAVGFGTVSYFEEEALTPDWNPGQIIGDWPLLPFSELRS